MNTKRNQVLIGVIFVLTGVLALMHSALGSSIGALTLMGAGTALILLYKTKRKSWSLGAGCYMLLFGALFAAERWLGITGAFVPVIIAGVFFLAPGVIFMVLYYDKNKQGLLVPACILIWVGLFVFAFCIPGFADVSFGGFFICAGLAFVTMRLLGGHFLGNVFAYIGLISVGAGVLIMMGFPTRSGPFQGLTGLFPVAVICFGLIIIIKAMLNKK